MLCLSRMLKDLTVAWVRAVRKAWGLVLVVAFAISWFALGYVQENLGIHTTTADMISPSLDWRQRYIDFQRQFPHFEDTLAIVVDARVPIGRVRLRRC